MGGALTILLVFIVVERDPQMIWNVLNLGQLDKLSFWIPGVEHIESHGIKLADHYFHRRK